MFMENQIEEMGNALLRKANLESSARFSILPEPWLEDANAFALANRTVYCIPERNFYEFKSIAHLLGGQFGANAKTYLEVVKINISHEVGHAMQTDLEEKEQELCAMKSSETLENFKTADELLKHAEAYKKRLIQVEADAWEKAWNLIKEQTDETLFGVIKRLSLESYELSDYLNEEDRFRDAFEAPSFEKGNWLEMLGIDDAPDGQIFRVKIQYDGEIIHAELLEKDNDYHWLKDKAKLLDKDADLWEPFPVWEFSDLATFAAGNLKNSRQVRF